MRHGVGVCQKTIQTGTGIGLPCGVEGKEKPRDVWRSSRGFSENRPHRLFSRGSLYPIFRLFACLLNFPQAIAYPVRPAEFLQKGRKFDRQADRDIA